MCLGRLRVVLATCPCTHRTAPRTNLLSPKPPYEVVETGPARLQVTIVATDFIEERFEADRFSFRPAAATP